MKKFIALLLAVVMVLGLVACASGTKDTAEKDTAAPATDAPATDAPAADDAPATDAPAAEGTKVYNVAYLVNGNLGDKSFFDSAEAGLETLRDDGRITLRTIEMGGTEEDQASCSPTWTRSLLLKSMTSSSAVLIRCPTTCRQSPPSTRIRSSSFSTTTPMSARTATF